MTTFVKLILSMILVEYQIIRLKYGSSFDAWNSSLTTRIPDLYTQCVEL